MDERLARESSVACISKGVLVIAFIARITRDYPVFKAGMQRAVRSDAGGVQKCSDAQPWLLGRPRTSYRLSAVGMRSVVNVRALHLIYLGGWWSGFLGWLLTLNVELGGLFSPRKVASKADHRVDVEPRAPTCQGGRGM